MCKGDNDIAPNRIILSTSIPNIVGKTGSVANSLYNISSINFMVKNTL